MADMISGYTVVLEKNLRSEDAEAIRSAILMIKGVLSVEDKVTEFSEYAARKRVAYEIENKLLGVLREA